MSEATATAGAAERGKALAAPANPSGRPRKWPRREHWPVRDYGPAAAATRDDPSEPWEARERMKRAHKQTEPPGGVSAAPTALAQASRILKSLEAEGDAMSKMHTSLRNHLTRLQCEEHVLKEMLRRSREARLRVAERAGPRSPEHGSEG